MVAELVFNYHVYFFSRVNTDSQVVGKEHMLTCPRSFHLFVIVEDLKEVVFFLLLLFFVLFCFFVFFSVFRIIHGYSTMPGEKRALIKHASPIPLYLTPQKGQLHKAPL